MEKNKFSSPLPLTSVRVTDTFWKSEIELVRKEVIPYQWEAINDRIPEAAKSYCMRNFKRAGEIEEEKRRKGKAYKQMVYPVDTFETLPKDGKMDGRFYGFVFQDSDFSKWIEAAAYSLAQHPDAQLEKTADEAIDLVCKAQREDGYLDTFYLINDESRIFTNLRDHHELYCFGHLAEGAVAYYQSTGKDKLLKAAMRFADFIDSRLGAEEGKLPGYPGHEIAEMALMRLYDLTGEERYLNLARFFLDERGKKPYYFDLERGETCKEGELRYEYHQAHLPVREQKEAAGHAVRAVYLYSGMADAARVTGDEELYQACERLWDSIVQEKMYLTGGIGGTHIGEAFSFPYDLPNDTAYAETCASIGLVFFARRMLSIRPASKYADVMELALYNGVLSGMALDGKSFFYVNPLEVLPEACRKDERKFHVKPVRQKWFGCACCPPNIARTISSVTSYAFTSREDTLWVHLYMGADIQTVTRNGQAGFTLESSFPWNGDVSLRCTCDVANTYTVALRIPGWCRDYQLLSDCGAEKKTEDGYLYLTKQWKEGDTVRLCFPMEAQFIEADLRVREDIGKAAIMRGPLVYCMEEADNGSGLPLFQLDASRKPEIKDCEEMGRSFIRITAYGEKRIPSNKQEKLYRQIQKPEYEACRLQYIPYFMWNNRGEGEMQVFTSIFY